MNRMVHLIVCLMSLAVMVSSIRMQLYYCICEIVLWKNVYAENVNFLIVSLQVNLKKQGTKPSAV